MNIYAYDRTAAVAYATQWAFSRNPRYYDFSELGGDCTNFVSQCLYAGCGVMNYAPVYGWYYISASQRAPAWSGTGYLYNFLTGNTAAGPFGTALGPFTPADSPPAAVQVGDVVQLRNPQGQYYHTLLVTDLTDGVKVTGHSIDVLNKPLRLYTAPYVRYIHIEGYREA